MNLHGFINAPLDKLALEIAEHFPLTSKPLNFSQVHSSLRVRPTILFPLQRVLAGERHLLDELFLTLSSYQGSFEPLFIAVDRWFGEFSLELTLTEYGNILQKLPTKYEVIALGPTTKEIFELSRKTKRSIEDILSVIRDARFQYIDGGTSLEIHEKGFQAGFLSSLIHDVSYLFEPSDSDILLERFIDELEEIREKVPSLKAWTPTVTLLSKNLLSLQSAPIGALFPRMIGIARLALPEAQFIRTPLTLFGYHLASLCTFFGANDLGFVGYTTESAKMLGIPSIHEVEFILSRIGDNI
jgi:hypothetical protein